MYESPASLQEVCLESICDSISALCEVRTNLDDGHSKLVFRSDEIYLPSNISDFLLANFCEKGILTDETLSLFDPSITRLKRVSIKDAKVTTKGLRTLKAHKICELEAVGLKSITVNDLIGCLGEWTLSHLRALNVTNSAFMAGSTFCVVVSLSKLQNLQTLNVSNTAFNKRGLDIIVEDLPSLENLDISGTPVSDLAPLRKCKSRLKSLSMYNLRASHNEEIVSILLELKQLRHLDVSDDFSVQPFVSLQPVKFRVRDLLSNSKGLPHLTSLDVSGKDGIKEDILKDFLTDHPNLRFLGLALTKACEMPMFTEEDDPNYVSNIKMTGEATEKQILEALRRYPNRAVYVQRSLYHLFSITQGMVEPRADIIKMLLPGMKNHPRELGVQMAATACLYNLCKGELGQKIHPSWLSKIVNLTLNAMQNFPNHQQLQKNALLTLCSDRILQDVTFNRFRCARLVMECLCAFDDPSMNRMSVAICSILAAKIPTEQTSELGASATFVRKLLAIVKEKTENRLVDITMKFTLSALWNLTDESPSTCEVFLNEGGLTLFVTVLQEFKGQPDDTRVQVETKVLGLINNLAEVKQLRRQLMHEDVVPLIRELLKSDILDVSYFAAGILSHLASDGPEAWTIQNTNREEALGELEKVVLKWEQPQGEMVAYRSFSPFFPLLAQFEAPAVQLWAVWAIQHVCTRNSARYCPMLVSEKGAEMLSSLVRNLNSHVEVVKICRKVLDLVEQSKTITT